MTVQERDRIYRAAIEQLKAQQDALRLALRTVA